MPTKVYKIRKNNKSKRKTKKTKSFSQSTTTDVTETLGNSNISQHYTTDDIDEKHKIQHNIHLNLHCSSNNSRVKSSDTTDDNNCTKSTNLVISSSLNFIEKDFKFSKEVDPFTYEKKRPKKTIGGFIRCSPCCCFMTALCILFLLTSLVALILGLLQTKKSTGTSTTMTTGTTLTTTSTTSITSTTTTALDCGQSCLNQSWINQSNEIARWSFDGTLNDSISGYNPISSLNLPTITTGYLGQAALFNASAQQSIFTPFIPLYNRSFTIEAWIKPTGYPNVKDHSIVGLCPTYSSHICLHLMIRYQKLYFGFQNYDQSGTTNLIIQNWYHVAFVYDYVTTQQTVYLNGFQNGYRTGFPGFLAFTGNFTIGTNTGVSTPSNYYEGYMDELSISYRPKSSCEILERATLAARFRFDSSSPYADSGPNSVSTNQSITSLVMGHKNQAVSFIGSSTSYFQTWGFTSLGISNQPFSIAFWIKPQTLSGTLIHLSSMSTGTGSTCFPLLGFAANGAIIAQVLTSAGTIISATGPVLPTSSSWIPIIQTWSTTNGLKLYVNGTLVSTVAASTFLGSETTPNYLTLGNCLSGCGVCSIGMIGSPGPYAGGVDEWHIFNRELTFSDVCTFSFLV